MAKGGDKSSKGASAKATGEEEELPDGIPLHGKAKIWHIVDPFSGESKPKVSIPKNYRGRLLLGGLNITSLSPHLITVRFIFGREMGMVDVPATVGDSPGMTPETNRKVLILDLGKAHLEDIRLLYDLYDYNNYDSDGDGVEFEEEDDKINIPVDSPLNEGLYCRGLHIEHDPTFKGGGGNVRCDEKGETCLYAYAKIKDSTLVDKDGMVGIPQEPHIFLDLEEEASASIDTALKVALPDINNKQFFKGVFSLNLHPKVFLHFPGNSLNFGDIIEIVDRSLSAPVTHLYTYHGPYRPVAINDWEITHQAMVSDNGLFKALADNSTGEGKYDCLTSTKSSGCANRGIKSLLFPRASRIDIREGVVHYSSPTPNPPRGGRIADRLPSAGMSEYMDGVNLRVMGYDDFTNEGIGSCNVTALIKVLAKNRDTGKYTVLDQTEEIKLQLTRPSLLNKEKEEVHYTALKNCSDPNSCSSDECCLNNRCWPRKYVSGCPEDSTVLDNRKAGESCQKDWNCSSLCCKNGVCGVHTTRGDEEVLCGKFPGESCVAQEWCRRENIFPLSYRQIQYQCQRGTTLHSPLLQYPHIWNLSQRHLHSSLLLLHPFL